MKKWLISLYAIFSILFIVWADQDVNLEWQKVVLSAKNTTLAAPRSAAEKVMIKQWIFNVSKACQVYWYYGTDWHVVASSPVTYIVSPKYFFADNDGTGHLEGLRWKCAEGQTIKLWCSDTTGTIFQYKYESIKE